MHFSKTTEYAIRVLTYLYRYSEKPQSVTHLHNELDLPYKYLTKMMTELEKKGLLIASKGRNGGFTLAINADEIYLCDIVEALGESLEANRCILGFEMCDASNPCSLHSRWLEPKKAIDAMLQTTSLASLIENKTTKI